MTKAFNMGRLPRPLSAGSLQRLDITTASKPPAGPSHLSNRSARQVPVRAAAALYSSPQQPCLVHGCPVRGHLDLDASSAGEINHRIKLSAQWGDVAKVVTEMGERLQPSNIAYALYRLGCLFCYLSSQRKAALEKSGMLERLVGMAAKRVGSFGPSELTFVLDGMARLQVKAPAAFMIALAQRAAALAQELEADQLPLVYWAFATLRHSPSAEVLEVLDARVLGIASHLSAQGVTLVLSACCALQHQPAEGLLDALAAAMKLTLSSFKRQELASCLDAFKALAFHPGNDLIQDVARMAGVQVSQEAMRSEPAMANNIISGRPRTPSTQGALQRAREMTAISAKQILSAGSASGGSLHKGQPAIRGAAKNAVCSKASSVQKQPLQKAGSLQDKGSRAIVSQLPQGTSSQDPCSYWRFRGKQDVVDHVQTHQ